MSSYSSISSEKLSRLIGTASSPALVDVRIDEDFAADPRLIPGATRRSHRDVQDWASDFTGQSVVVICHTGGKLSEGTAAWLRHNNIASENLEGQRGAHAAAADFDDVVGIRLRCRPARGRNRCRLGDASIAGYGGVRRHARRDCLRSSVHPRVLYGRSQDRAQEGADWNRTNRSSGQRRY
jgi:rhodanese-related sulfurtransferase